MKDDSKSVRVEVRDGGPRIEPGRAEQLFEPFYQAAWHRY
jgi:signal transduction histidine kinase